MEYRRQFEVNGKNFLVLQCGENNILKSKRGESKSVFRLDKSTELKRRFEEVLGKTDVVLNPTHTPWIDPFIREPFISRMQTFSEKNRYCFTCTQMKGQQLAKARKNPTDNSTMKGMHSRRLIKPIFTNENADYLVQIFEIE